MLPSLFTLGQPVSVFQWWFVVYLYLLPFLLWAAFATLTLMDVIEARRSRPGWVALAVLVPVAGAALYLLTAARSLKRVGRIAIVVSGLVLWLVPLAVGLWLAGGPLGPKALAQ